MMVNTNLTPRQGETSPVARGAGAVKTKAAPLVFDEHFYRSGRAFDEVHGRTDLLGATQ